MSIASNTSFTQLNANNQIVDETIEGIVNIANSLDEHQPRPDKLELEKTTRLLFLSSLIMGERDDDDSAELED